jgi:hypothetical protein
LEGSDKHAGDIQKMRQSKIHVNVFIGDLIKQMNFGGTFEEIANFYYFVEK